MRGRAGFSVIELMVAMTILMSLLLGVLLTYSKGRDLSRRVRSHSRIQDNVRLALGRLELEIRMAGSGVPTGDRVGGADSWSPAVFHASATEIGFRAEIDGGSTLVTCTPSSSNSDCPLDELQLESVIYHDDLNCKQPDDPGASLKLVVARDGQEWEPATCSSVSVGDKSLAVSDLTDDTFSAGVSQALTLEQVYYRYVPLSQAPYGYLQRYVQYDNVPDDSFPPSPVDWTIVADHLTDFWLEYRDANGSVLSGTPLSEANREAIRKVLIYIEGYDQVGVEGQSLLMQVQSEILVRNASL